MEDQSHNHFTGMKKNVFKNIYFLKSINKHSKRFYPDFVEGLTRLRQHPLSLRGLDLFPSPLLGGAVATRTTTGLLSSY